MAFARTCFEEGMGNYLSEEEVEELTEQVRELLTAREPEP